jgi:chromosome segregation ATPase
MSETPRKMMPRKFPDDDLHEACDRELAAVTRERDEARNRFINVALDMSMAHAESEALQSGIDHLRETCDALERERDEARKDAAQVRELMNVYNAGGWTDADRLMKERDALRAEVERLRRKWGGKRMVFQAGRDSYKTDCNPMNTDDEAWEEYTAALTPAEVTTP